jgi:hypothetical protein
MMDTKRIARAGALAVFGGGALVLAFGAIFAGSLREHFVFAPRERGAESAIRQVAARERAIRKSTGDFLTFGNKDIEGNQTLLGIFWDQLPTNDFTFDAMKLDSGNVRLRALPRPEKVDALAVRARFYVVELKPDGAVAHDGWLPAAN